MNSNTEPHVQTQRHSVKREDIWQVCRMCPERPYVQLQVPVNAKSVQQVKFTIVSHDQGKIRHHYIEASLTEVHRLGRSGNSRYLCTVLHVVWRGSQEKSITLQYNYSAVGSSA